MLNSFLLGLSSKAPLTWTGTGDLFSRPKALAVVSVMGVKTMSLSHLKATYTLNGDVTNMDSVSETLKRTFGAGFEWIEATSGKISGTKIASVASEQQEKQVKAHVAPLRGLNGDVTNMDSVSETLKRTFDPGFEWIEATLGKISGTKIASVASEQQEKQVKAHVAPLRGEIQDIYKIADSVGI
uniref:BON domain-containing protein n=1 Tax=Ascaris lumbricoides TaxID=6252 RepID=A0A0M3ID66_ASCLU